MMKRLLFLLIGMLLLSGCAAVTMAKDNRTAPAATEPPLALATLTAEPEPTATAAATVTVPATATATAIPTRTATRTPQPTTTPSATPTATATLEPMARTEHIVQAGESLGLIAAQYNLGVSELTSYNGITDPNKLSVGQVLRIPLGSEAIREMRVTATAAALLTPTPAATLPERAVIEMAHSYQKANNCAPATTSMILSVYGVSVTQLDMATIQKPVPQDVNVTAEEVAASIRDKGLQAYVGYNGTIDLMQTLIAAGFPVMSEEWMQYDGGVGHFRAIRGYDRTQGQILYNDSYYGPSRWRSENEFLRDWAAFNYKYVVAYRPEQAATLRGIIGPSWDQATMFETLRRESAARVASNPADGYAWWGLGEALTRQGRHEEAIGAYESAINSGALPWRYTWYRYGYLESMNAAGQHSKLLEYTSALLGQMVRSEDVRYHRAVAFRALGDTESAIIALRKALEDNPRFGPAQILLNQLGG